MGDKSASRDIEIAAVAARQHGVVTHRQLLVAGLGRNAISKRVHAGRLHRLHQGVYAVGHVADSSERRWMAAVLASGPRAALSHMGAAVLWGLLRPADGPVDVSVPTQNGRRGRPGIRLHRRRSLSPDQTTSRKGIPVTTPARTIEDLRRTEGIAVETDFYGYHRGRVAFRDDRARDLDLRRHGFAVHRFSEEQIDNRPAEVAADLRDALALAS